MIDTDILIDQERGVPAAAAFLTMQHAAGPVFVSVISAMELVQGCRNAAELRNVRTLLATITVLPLGEVASQTAFRLMDTLVLSHGLRLPDALIAASALEHGMTLYTKNTRDFRMIPGLSVVRPY